MSPASCFEDGQSLAPPQRGLGTVRAPQSPIYQGNNIWGAVSTSGVELGGILLPAAVRTLVTEPSPGHRSPGKGRKERGAGGFPRSRPPAGTAAGGEAAPACQRQASRSQALLHGVGLPRLVPVGSGWASPVAAGRGFVVVPSEPSRGAGWAPCFHAASHAPALLRLTWGRPSLGRSSATGRAAGMEALWLPHAWQARASPH